MEIKLKPKVFSYDVKVRWAAQKHGMLTAFGKPDLEVASPPEFKGHPGVWTPEHLYVAAVNACTMLTFLSAATRREIDLVAYESDATGTLEDADGLFQFTRAVLRPRVIVRDQADIEKVRAALREAEASCLIANSLKTQVTIEPEISVLTPAEMPVGASVPA